MTKWLGFDLGKYRVTTWAQLELGLRYRGVEIFKWEASLSFSKRNQATLVDRWLALTQMHAVLKWKSNAKTQSAKARCAIVAIPVEIILWTLKGITLMICNYDNCCRSSKIRLSADEITDDILAKANLTRSIIIIIIIDYYYRRWYLIQNKYMRVDKSAIPDRS